MTEPESLQQIRRTYVRYRGRTLSYFTGCDYFRLSSHPAVLKALNDGVKRFGLNVAASRRTTGNHAIYLELEKRLARFFNNEAAVLVTSGYATNLVVAQTLAGDFAHVYVDEKSHMSVRDAAKLFRAEATTFKHRDAASLASAMKHSRGNCVVLSDGMFSHDGSVAPISDYLKLLRKNSLFVVDDAHGGGTIGKNGGGAVEICKVKDKRIVQCVTLSKSFGCFGGAIICTKELRERIIANSPMFMGSTPLPLPLANAAIAAIQVLRSNKSLRARLNRNADFVKQSLREAGMNLAQHPGPIIPFPLRTAAENARLHRALLEAGIFPSFIRYGNASATGYFRFVISSEHTRSQLDALVKTLKPFVSR